MAVILTILKWILRIVLIILGIIVLLLLICFFSGIRYKAEGIKNEKKTAFKGSVKYLFGIVSFRFMYKDKKLMWQAKIFKKTLASSGRGERKKSDVPSAEKELVPQVKEAPDTLDKPDCALPGTDTEPEFWKEEKVLNAPEKEDSPQKEKKTSRLSALKRREIRFRRKIYGIIKKIRHLSEKKETLEDLLNDPVIQGAMEKGVSVLKKVLSKIAPKMLEGEVRFGLSDPYYTGKILAFLSVVYPSLPGDFTVVPDFEEKIFEGKGRISGCVRLKTFAGAAISLLINKNVRESIKIIKKMKDTGGK